MIPQDNERRAQLFRAAGPIFDRFGYRKTTIEEICREAGMSKRTFYEEFRDKSEFFGNMVLFVAMEWTREWYEATETVPSAASRIEALIDMYIATCHASPLFQVIFENDESLAAVSDAFDGPNTRPLHAALVPTLEMGMANGEFRQIDVDKTPLIISTMLDSMFCILPQLFRKFPLEQDERFLAELKTFIIHGLLAR